ncbi:MAG: hypothetical protein KAH01_06425 [Caldisericia bacterium]|nr:hypothetical protein [Caldisericia bacterium]
MKNKIIIAINELNVPDVELAEERTLSCLNDAKFYSTEPYDFFFTDYLVGKERELKSFFLFYENFMLHFPKFMQQDEMNFYCIQKAIVALEVRKKCFTDPETTTVKSRFSVSASLYYGKNFEIKSTGKNCINAFRITQNYIMKNLKS